MGGSDGVQEGRWWRRGGGDRNRDSRVNFSKTSNVRFQEVAFCGVLVPGCVSLGHCFSWGVVCATPCAGGVSTAMWGGEGPLGSRESVRR